MVTTSGLRQQLVLDGASVPALVRRLGAELRPGAEVTPLWRNELGGWTVALGHEGDSGNAPTVLKWVPAATLAAHPHEPTPADEAARLHWIGERHPVPHLVDTGTTTDGDQWMLTLRLSGTTAVSDRWRSEPRTALRALGEGLRALHEALPVEDCPWTFGPAVPTAPDAHGEHTQLRGAPAPASADRVVLHGDACAPNTLLDDHGRWVAHVDMGALGVGDRWFDLAVGAQSLGWNYGPGWESEYLAAYGIAPDAERMRAWRDWWNRPDAADGDDAESEP